MTHTWAVGDIHGCLDELKLLLKEIPETDNIVFLGDYIDRGIDSLGVVDFVWDNKDNPRFVFLRGNHEQMMIDTILENPDPYCWGWRLEDTPTIHASGRAHQIATRMNDMLLWYHEMPGVRFVHGGIPFHDKDKELADISRNQLIWHRPNRPDDWPTDYHLIHGHTPIANVFAGQYRTNIDTACVYDGFLTAARVGPTGKPDEFIQIRKIGA